MHNQAGVEEYDALTGLLSRSAGEVQIAEAIQDSSGCLALMSFIDFEDSILTALFLITKQAAE